MTVATVKSNITVIQGKVGNVTVEIMLDTGSAVSLLRHNEASRMETYPIPSGNPFIELVTASGEPLPVLSCVAAPVQMLNTNITTQKFLVVNSLIYPVILGTDFLYRHQLSLDFTSSPVTVQQHMLIFRMYNQCGMLKGKAKLSDMPLLPLVPQTMT